MSNPTLQPNGAPPEHGAEQLPSFVPCPTCFETGVVAGTFMDGARCPSCGGAGRVPSKPASPMQRGSRCEARAEIGVLSAMIQKARESARVAELDLRAALAAAAGFRAEWIVLYDLLEPLTRIASRLEHCHE